MAFSSVPFVGRGAELAALDECLRAAQVRGDRDRRRARDRQDAVARRSWRRGPTARGCLVLTGSASELEADLPFGVFVDALDEYLHALEPRRLDELDDAARRARPRLPLARPRHDGAPVERYRLHRAVRELLEALAVPKPLVLHPRRPALGGLGLAGAAGRAAAPAAGGAACCSRSAIRPRQIPERLAGALERAAQHVTRIELGSLSAAEARELRRRRRRRAVRRLRRQPVLPPAARARAAPEQRRADRRARRRRGAAGRRRFAGVRAGAALRRRAQDARGRGRGRRSVRARARRGRRRPRRGTHDRRDRRAAGERSHPAHRRPAPLPLPPSARAPRRLRGRPAGWRIGAHERSARALEARGASAVERAHHVERSARHGDAEAIAVLRDGGAEVAARARPPIRRPALRRRAAAGRPRPRRSGAELLGAMAEAHMAAAASGPRRTPRCSEALRAAPPRGARHARAAERDLRARSSTLLGRHSDARARLRRDVARVTGRELGRKRCC